MNQEDIKRIWPHLRRADMEIYLAQQEFEKLGMIRHASVARGVWLVIQEGLICELKERT